MPDSDLNTSDAQLRALRDFSSSLAEARDLDDVLRSLARCTQSVLAWDDCVIYLRSGPRRLAQRAAYGPKSPDGIEIVDPIELAFGEGIVGAAAESAESQLVRDTRTDPRYVIDDEDRLSELAVPILVDGEVVGVIDSEHREDGFYTNNHRLLLEDVAQMVAVRLKAANDVDQVEREMRRIDQLAHSDELTGVGNRQRFETTLAEALNTGDGVTVALIDIDRFKLLNDRLGSQKADELLIGLAELLQDEMLDTDTISRLSADEFGVVRSESERESTNLEADLARVVERAKAGTPTSDVSERLSLSVGVATGSDTDVWRTTEDALRAAKRKGGGVIVRMDPGSVAAARQKTRRTWAQRMAAAFERDQLFLVGQPIVPLQSPGTPAYHEMLLRYRDDDGIVHTPDAFLDSAARFGLLERIDGWVIRTTTEWLSNSPGQRASVNVTPRSMINGFALGQVREGLTDFDLDPCRLIIEVTEQTVIEDEYAFRRAVSAARNLGIRVAIDDLGSGWSSITTVRDAAIDTVKIDGSWVSKAATDPLAEITVRAMVDAAKLLGATTVAEWIEDQRTADLMRKIGVDLGQGWLFGRPIPLDDILADEMPAAA